MNKKVLLTTGLILAASMAQAAVISVNFATRSGATEDDRNMNLGASVGQAGGVNGSTVWNDTTPANLGAPSESGITVTGDAGESALLSYAAAGSWGNNLGSDANNSLMNSFIMSNAGTGYSFSMTGLDDDFTNGYDIYLYVAAEVGKAGGQGTLTLSQGTDIASQEYTATVFDGSTFPQVTGLGYPGGSYIKFTNVTGDAFAVTFSGIGGDIESGLTGFEVVAVPEPATLSLVGLAFGGLVMLKRRKK